MGETDELAIKVFVVVALDVCFEVVATNDMIGFEEEPGRVVDVGTASKQMCIILVKHVGTASKQMCIILVKLAIDPVDITIDCGSKYS